MLIQGSFLSSLLNLLPQKGSEKMLLIYLLGAVGISFEIATLFYTFTYKNSKYAISMTMHILGTVCCLLYLCILLILKFLHYIS